MRFRFFRLNLRPRIPSFWIGQESWKLKFMEEELLPRGQEKTSCFEKTVSKDLRIFTESMDHMISISML